MSASTVAEKPMRGCGAATRLGMLRLRQTIRLAALRMTAEESKFVHRIFIITFLIWSSLASATTYYVSSSTGNDSNSGTSSSTAWQTIAHVNGQSFQPGD